ncbi:MAG TPA: ATP-binding protein [Clostridia bacterium]|nr:ATP-binding protein [Clostridia bacterium]
MTDGNVFDVITKRTKQILDAEENYEIEFKQSVGGLDSSDIVAFANSEHGGTILIGVKEDTGEKNRQRGKIIGCDIGDQERLNILSKANSCIPKVDMEIYVENLKMKPFFRIEILPGKNKPYCTAGGTYKIRGYGLNEILDPSRLLSMFLESENDRFLKRFTESTRKLESTMERANSIVFEEISKMAKATEDMKKNLDKNFSGLSENIANGKSEENALVRIEKKIDELAKLKETQNK